VKETQTEKAWCGSELQSVLEYSSIVNFRYDF
jgi:hypothetical protein